MRELNLDLALRILTILRGHDITTIEDVISFVQKEITQETEHVKTSHSFSGGESLREAVGCAGYLIQTEHSGQSKP